MNERAASTNKAYNTTNDWNKSKTGESCGNKTENSTLKRGNSVGGKSAHQIAEEESRAKSYKNRPYINNAKTGTTDYKFNYGEKIGSTPMDLMNRVSYKQPLRDHPLKRGTNQLWSEIPNYQGFKPSELPFKEYKNRIEGRNEAYKGNLKLQVTDNFLVNVPGYGGYKPQYQNQNDKLRSSCLATNK